MAEDLVDNIIGDYEIFEMVGKGSFATVWVGRNRITNCPVAVKQFTKNEINSNEVLATMHREISIMRMLNHPLIVDLYEVVETEDNIFMILEYVENDTLLEYVNMSSPIGENKARMFFAQIIAVMHYLHSEKRVVHRDLKAENVLLDRNGNIRVIDFGLSNVLNQTTSSLNTACGSSAYVAPEMLMNQPYTQSADIWSAGILLYAINASHLPFEDKNVTRLIDKVLHESPVFPVGFSTHLTDLITKMLSKNPEQRITLEGIIQHPWFTSDQMGTPLVYNIGAVDEYRMLSDPLHFNLDESVLNQVKSFGIDVSCLKEDIMLNKMTRATAAYRSIYKEKVTDSMVMLSDEIMFKAERHLSFSTLTLNIPEAMLQLPPLKSGNQKRLGTPQSKIPLKATHNLYGTFPSINKIPSRGPGQVLSLLVPNVKSRTSTVQTRVIGKPTRQ